MLNPLMYKLSYFKFVETDGGRGYDRVRKSVIGKKHFKLTHFIPAFEYIFHLPNGCLC
ncbi:hypothetical protein Lser_V15G06151 [Lactuca serriola]